MPLGRERLHAAADSCSSLAVEHSREFILTDFDSGDLTVIPHTAVPEPFRE